MSKRFRVSAVAIAAILSLAMWVFSIHAQTDAPKLNHRVNVDLQDLEIRVFTLKNAEAEMLATTIKPLFTLLETTPMAIVSDKRTNAVIARGPRAELSVLEALLLRLDELTPNGKAK